ncbi:MAG TPA: 3-hydroxyacyl-CoA dehydrogenase family protein [Candidatus Agrococcus pullicola]|uniref:3-hydroxyacyl-CoA dehydrogenase family protein n=1 Tax=Candidatus Agrococcus pullicola TaxID=2838429 RepID=A0A9D2C8Z3_9MICO|nr:3-hydroxyacyl-CoA dehydrogenase family protein [Candidatus Agrococcus pullicola]
MNRVGVLGGGRMGSGIAHAFLITGSEVVVVERDVPAADAALARVRSAVTKSIDRGADVAEGTDERLDVGTDVATFAECSLVIEAVPEEPDLKVQSLRRAEAAMSPAATLASNTSSISIDRLAKSLERPERFLGLHFFNPVPASKLVEIVVGAATRPQLREIAQGWVRQIGKTPVTVTDSPGFASSRLGVALGLEAIRMVDEGVASAEDIDAAMELGYRHPAGPLRTTDIVGLDVRLGIAEELARELGPRFEPPRLLRDMVAKGELGRKTGKGFYDWGTD